MDNYFADLHIHIGTAGNGRWVKMATSRSLTLANILREAMDRKSIDIIGIVDSLSPWVMADVAKLTESGDLSVLAGGGYRYRDRVTLLLGVELETREDNGGCAHVLGFFPDMCAVAGFAAVMARHIKNMHISSQNCHMPMARLCPIIVDHGGIPVPAHAFTPHKGVLGACAARLRDILPDAVMAQIPAIELGLSADTDLADRIAELAELTFLSNSDAHSPGKIGREYNVMRLAAPDFGEVAQALLRKNGRMLVGNYGLDPKLGKYHRTHCEDCGHTTRTEPPVTVCPACGGEAVVVGVLDRINIIADFAVPRHPAHRPPYHYQIPLEFIPGLGPRKLAKLIGAFGSEMAVLHTAGAENLADVAGTELAGQILLVRAGKAPLAPGGGGHYGRIIVDRELT